jgi:hypothetical protein
VSDYRMVYASCSTNRSHSDARPGPIHYCVEVDLEALATLARKAARNKGQKANMGPVRVTILNPTQAEFLKAGA